MIFKAAGMELNITAVATSEETGAAYDAAVNVLDRLHCLDVAYQVERRRSTAAVDYTNH